MTANMKRNIAMSLLNAAVNLGKDRFTWNDLQGASDEIAELVNTSKSGRALTAQELWKRRSQGVYSVTDEGYAHHANLLEEGLFADMDVGEGDLAEEHEYETDEEPEEEPH